MNEVSGNQVLQIDVIGYRAQMGSMKPWRLLFEIFANAFDEDTIKKFDIKITYDKKREKVIFEYIDDGDGFRDWLDIISLFKRSMRRKDPTKSGRFNLGEKQAIIVSSLFRIWTRNPDEAKAFEFKWYKKTAYRKDLEPLKELGTKIYAEYDWTEEEFKEINTHLGLVRCPANKKCIVNGNRLTTEKAIRKFKGELKTEIEDPKTFKMIKTRRNGDIEIYNKESDNARTWLYENGLPIQKLKKSDRWHVNVLQKIPMAPTRSDVAPTWLDELYGVLINNTIDLVEKEDMNDNWVQAGMKDATVETMKQIKIKKFGTENVFFESSSDPTANDRVRDDPNAALIEEGWGDKEVRDRMKDLGVAEPAHIKYGVGRGLDMEKPVTITPAMEKYRQVCKALAMDCIDADIKVRFVRSPEQSMYSAWWNRDTKTLTFNFSSSTINTAYFNQWNEDNVELIIHELAHDKDESYSRIQTHHYTTDYVSELSRIGAIIGVAGIAKWSEK